MKEAPNPSINDVTALVARQFEPTRIERQLLAQTFDLVCKRTFFEQEGVAGRSAVIETTTRIENQPPLNTSVAGRRAA